MPEPKKFINELGNEIVVSVKDKSIEGVDGILISISGPTSSTEVHVTKEEAKVILQELSSVLEKNNLD